MLLPKQPRLLLDAKFLQYNVPFVALMLAFATPAYSSECQFSEQLKNERVSDLTDSPAGESVQAKSRRVGRSGRAPAKGGVDSNRDHRQRNKAKRSARQVKSPQRLAASTGSGLYLSGSFALNMGGKVISQGEGNVTLELDQATAEQLEEIIGKQMDQVVPLTKDFLQAIVTLPETIRSTSEILKRLSEPDTQRNLQQVEQLLQLFSQLPDRPVVDEQ